MTDDHPSPAHSFDAWSRAADAVRNTPRRLEKLAALQTYLPTLDDESLGIAAQFFSGIVFPRHDQRTTQVGSSTLRAALGELTGASDDAQREVYSRHGDSGEMAEELLAAQSSGMHSLQWVASRFGDLAAARDLAARRAIVRDTLGEMGGREARYFAKLLGGELRIGLKESQMEEALARTFSEPLDAVRHANVLRGDIGEVAVLTRHHRLSSATLALFHPIGFMLAQPMDTPAEIIAAMPTPCVVEDKYDGIRAQAHVDGAVVRLYSRTLDDITHGYPEVVAALSGIGLGLVLDGELIAVHPEDVQRARPFTALQRRLGRKKPSATLIEETPVAFVGYDVLAADGVLVIEESYDDRRSRLEALKWPDKGAVMAQCWRVEAEEDVEFRFERARESGNEGLIIKHPGSPYTPGRRGGSWLKLKRALATLDVVVTGVERGHGRRNGVLSDYTFAVRTSETDPTLLTVGKAYNGLTDVEIAELTQHFLASTTQQFGRFHAVRPEIVLEVTFDIVQRSKRHKAGYALRFPRIVRIRHDKRAEEIDTLERVQALAGEA